MRMKRRIAVLMILALLCCGCMAQGEEKTMTEQEWYRRAMQDSVISTGNSLRLKKVIERAQAGEQITVATVGGSITEGAAARRYDECWASRFAALFGEAYGTDGGTNVTLVNSGVGGTPSSFGWMRYGRDILERVPEEDGDGLPDLVVIEYAVNDWGEPTHYRCYESMVKEILSQPNSAAVILLFTVRDDGWNMQDDLQKIGERYHLPMISIRDGIYPHIGSDYPKKSFYNDEYHPKSAGHAMMADALMEGIREAAAAETPAADTDPEAEPVYGTDFTGLKTLYGGTETADYTIERGSFDQTDRNAYRNTPVGVVCGEQNFCHGFGSEGNEPLKVTGVFSKCLVSWLASADATYGAAEVYADGTLQTTLQGGAGKWGQSEVVLILDDPEAAEHTLEIQVTEKGKKFTITAISLK